MRLKNAILKYFREHTRILKTTKDKHKLYLISFFGCLTNKKDFEQMHVNKRAGTKFHKENRILQIIHKKLHHYSSFFSLYTLVAFLI
jgi:hypothetical protein